MADIGGLLRIMVSLGGSDLHIKAGAPPSVRVDGVLRVLRDMPAYTPQEAEALAASIMNDRQRLQFENQHEVDFAYSVHDVGRFRANVFHQRGTVGVALRRVVKGNATIHELGLPATVLKLADEPRGLVLVTGTAGSGKTTTLASMIAHINSSREGHIVTIEDPIEVLHTDDRCVINQREIGLDTDSYADALRHVVRQDPDIIFIGEMRDHETVSAALTAAEIGNLVLSTLHTIDATETISRIIDFFPPYQQKQIRLMLASTLKGIISLRLIPSVSGGLVPAVEIMVMTGTIREYITDPEQTYKIRDAMEDGVYYGMQTFDQSLLRLFQEGRIALDDAIAMAANAHDFKIKLRQIGVSAAETARSGVY